MLVVNICCESFCINKFKFVIVSVDLVSGKYSSAMFDWWYSCIEWWALRLFQGLDISNRDGRCSKISKLISFSSAHFDMEGDFSKLKLDYSVNWTTAFSTCI